MGPWKLERRLQWTPHLGCFNPRKAIGFKNICATVALSARLRCQALPSSRGSRHECKRSCAATPIARAVVASSEQGIQQAEKLKCKLGGLCAQQQLPWLPTRARGYLGEVSAP